MAVRYIEMLVIWFGLTGACVYAFTLLMLAVILVIVVGTVRLIGTQANNVFSQTASAMGS